MDGWLICSGEHGAQNRSEVSELSHGSILHLSLCVLISPLPVIVAWSGACVCVCIHLRMYPRTNVCVPNKHLGWVMTAMYSPDSAETDLEVTRSWRVCNPIFVFIPLFTFNRFLPRRRCYSGVAMTPWQEGRKMKMSGDLNLFLDKKMNRRVSGSCDWR